MPLRPTGTVGGVDEQQPNPLPMVLINMLCPDNSARWFWHCDEHDVHGNADSEDEAHYVAAAHLEFCWRDPNAKDCAVTVWQRRPPAGADG